MSDGPTFEVTKALLRPVSSSSSSSTSSLFSVTLVPALIATFLFFDACDSVPRNLSSSFHTFLLEGFFLLYPSPTHCPKDNPGSSSTSCVSDISRSSNPSHWAACNHICKGQQGPQGTCITKQRTHQPKSLSRGNDLLLFASFSAFTTHKFIQVQVPSSRLAWDAPSSRRMGTLTFSSTSGTVALKPRVS